MKKIKWFIKLIICREMEYMNIDDYETINFYEYTNFLPKFIKRFLILKWNIYHKCNQYYYEKIYNQIIYKFFKKYYIKIILYFKIKINLLKLYKNKEHKLNKNINKEIAKEHYINIKLPEKIN